MGAPPLFASLGLAHDRNVSMVVAVVAVRVMEMAVHQVVDVIAMWDSLVTAVDAMRVGRVVAVAIVPVRAIDRVGSTHLEPVLIYMTLMRRVQVAVVQVVRVVVVLDCGVAAVCAVFVGMVLMDNMFVRHGCFSFGML